MKLDKRFVHKFFETAPCIVFKLFRNEKNMHGKKERKKKKEKRKRGTRSRSAVSKVKSEIEKKRF